MRTVSPKIALVALVCVGATLSLSMAFTRGADEKPTKKWTYKPSFRKDGAGNLVLHDVPPVNLVEIARLRAEYFAEHRGLKLNPHHEAKGDTLKLQQKIIAIYSEHEPVPASRIAHFQWLSREPVVFVGWGGYITETTPSRAGWLVKVRFSPRLESSISVTAFTTDYVDETYEYTGSALDYVGTELPPRNLQSVITF